MQGKQEKYTMDGWFGCTGVQTLLLLFFLFIITAMKTTRRRNCGCLFVHPVFILDAWCMPVASSLLFWSGLLTLLDQEACRQTYSYVRMYVDVIGDWIGQRGLLLIYGGDNWRKFSYLFSVCLSIFSSPFFATLQGPHILCPCSAANISKPWNVLPILYISLCKFSLFLSYPKKHPASHKVGDFLSVSTWDTCDMELCSAA